jgi:lactate dehydrogenase-like 2-hydroxyacid dehydrogenase
LVTADIFINFDREMLEQMPNIKAFFVQAVGFDQIDIEAAKELGIKVYNCPGYNANAVGEFVF